MKIDISKPFYYKTPVDLYWKHHGGFNFQKHEDYFHIRVTVYESVIFQELLDED